MTQPRPFRAPGCRRSRTLPCGDISHMHAPIVPRAAPGPRRLTLPAPRPPKALTEMERCPRGRACARSLASGFAKLAVTLSTARHRGTPPTLLLDEPALWWRFAALCAAALLTSDPHAEAFAAQSAALLLFPAADPLPEDGHLLLLRHGLREAAHLDRLFSGGSPRYVLLHLLCAPLGGATLPAEFNAEAHAAPWAAPHLRALERFLEAEAEWPQAGPGAADWGPGAEADPYPAAADAHGELDGRTARNARQAREAVLSLAQPSLHALGAGAQGRAGGLAGESAEVAERVIAVLGACERACDAAAAAAVQPRAAAAEAVFPLEALQVPLDCAVLHPHDARVQAAAWGLLQRYARLLADYSASKDRGARALAAQLRARWALWAPRAAESAVAALDECLLSHEPDKAAVADGSGCGKLHQPHGRALDAGLCAREIGPLLLCSETLAEYAASPAGAAAAAGGPRVAESPDWLRALGKVRAALGRAAGEKRSSGPGWSRRARAEPAAAGTWAAVAGELGAERLEKAVGALDALLAAAAAAAKG